MPRGSLYTSPPTSSSSDNRPSTKASVSVATSHGQLPATTPPPVSSPPRSKTASSEVAEQYHVEQQGQERVELSGLSTDVIDAMMTANRLLPIDKPGEPWILPDGFVADPTLLAALETAAALGQLDFRETDAKFFPCLRALTLTVDLMQVRVGQKNHRNVLSFVVAARAHNCFHRSSLLVEDIVVRLAVANDPSAAIFNVKALRPLSMKDLSGERYREGLRPSDLVAESTTCYVKQAWLRWNRTWSSEIKIGGVHLPAWQVDVDLDTWPEDSDLTMQLQIILLRSGIGSKLYPDDWGLFFPDARPEVVAWAVGDRGVRGSVDGAGVQSLDAETLSSILADARTGPHLELNYSKRELCHLAQIMQGRLKSLCPDDTHLDTFLSLVTQK
ncbi:hypothetical protein PYCC9005_001760 [Savitreella phatthalungensis]